MASEQDTLPLLTSNYISWFLSGNPRYIAIWPQPLLAQIDVKLLANKAERHAQPVGCNAVASAKQAAC